MASSKEKANKAALKLIPRVEELISICEDPLRMSILASIVVNKMDLEGSKENLKIFKSAIRKRVIPVSALSNEGLGSLKAAILKVLK